MRRERNLIRQIRQLSCSLPANRSRGAGHRRRLRCFAPPPALSFWSPPIFAWKTCISAAPGTRRRRRPPLPDARPERHCRHGRRSAGLFLLSGAARDLAADLGRWLLRGLLALARRFKVQLAGGDISSARQITADIVVTGQVPAGKAIFVRGPPRRPHLCHRIARRIGRYPEAALRREEGQAGKIEPSFLSHATA